MKVKFSQVSGRVRSRNSLDVARDAFALLVTGLEPLSLDGAGFPGLPCRRVPLDEVRDLLLARKCPPGTADAVWAFLVGRSRVEGAVWTVAAVGVALPALTAATAMLSRWFPGDAEDVPAEVLRGFLDALARIDVQRPRIMLRLRWAAYRAGHALLVKALKEQAVDKSVEAPLVCGHPDLVLARAVAEGVLTRTEAELIGVTRLESVAVARWAAERGVTEWAVYKARRRAEVRLAAYLREAGPAEDVADQAANAVAMQQKKSGRDMSKTDDVGGLQGGGEMPQTTVSPEVRPCA